MTLKSAISGVIHEHTLLTWAETDKIADWILVDPTIEETLEDARHYQDLRR